MKNPDLTLETDACETGWRAVYKKGRAHGVWTSTEKSSHINVLELRAILFGLKSFFPGVCDTHFLIYCDNITAVHTVNKMGTSHSWECNEVVQKIWSWAIPRKNWITVTHVPGKNNIQADTESRRDVKNKEWMMHKDVYKKFCQRLNSIHRIDLFASRVNYQIKPFISYGPDPEAKFVNAFTVDWGEWSPIYAFPPFAIIGKVLQKIKQDCAEGIVIVPNWPNQVWFSVLCRMLIDLPFVLHHRKKLLSLPSYPEETHPLLPKTKLLACRLSGNRSTCKNFQKKLSTLSLTAGAKVQENNTHRVLKSSFGTVLNGSWIPFTLL